MATLGGKSHPQHTQRTHQIHPISGGQSSLSFVVSNPLVSPAVSRVLFVNMTDVFEIEFLSTNESRTAVSVVAPAKSAAIAVHALNSTAI